MKRIIKFRGKCKDSGEWIYGDLVHNAIDGSSKLMEIGIKPDNCYPIEVIPETVGEFTGLHDKHGQEIFEGDIVMRNEKTCEVIWDKHVSSWLIGRFTYTRPDISCQNESWLEVTGRVDQRTGSRHGKEERGKEGVE